MHVDPHAVLAGGRRRHRRRNGLASAALAATVGMLAVGAVTVGDLGPAPLRPAVDSSTTASPSPPPTTAAPSPPPTTAAPSQEPVSARVAVEMGHCWVEDVSFDGQLWGLTDADQFGNGGNPPLSWEGTGVMVRVSADRARYTDDGGSVHTFLPIEDPTVFRKQGRGCL
jgi:hypothetical protein